MNRHVIVFLGPTLRRDEAARLLAADYRPPAAQGDIYRATLDRPAAIGLVDGYFHGVPAVWHKEILWALHEAIPVFGAASMGALRAAECEPFGMAGVGRIFEAFRDGILEDDDEVAILHAGAEAGYRTASDALVDIRCTLTAAEQAGVIRAATCSNLLAIGKGLFYQQRTFSAVLDRAAKDGVCSTELRAFESWLPAGRVDQKRADALEMLEAMARAIKDGVPPKRVSFPFLATDAWDGLRRSAAEPSWDPTTASEPPPEELAWRELRLDPIGYAEMRDEAAAVVLALYGAGEPVEVDDAAIRAAGEEFRWLRGLESAERFRGWLAALGLHEEQFEELMAKRAALRSLSAPVQRETESGVRDELRLRLDFARLAARGKDKLSRLGAAGLSDPDAAAAGISEDAAIGWFFTERLHRVVPMDLARFARALGFVDRGDLVREIFREYCYVSLLAHGRPSVK